MNKRLILSVIAVLGMNQQSFAMTLAEASQLALQNDPSWSAAEQRFQAQKQNLELSRNGKKTQVEINGSTGLVFGDNIDGDRHRSAVSLDATKVLYSGAENAKIQKAKVMQNSYEVELEIQREDELKRVTQAYLQALEKQDLQTLSKKEATSMKQYADFVRKNVSIGASSRNDELTFKVQLDSAMASLLNSELEVNSAKIELESIVGAEVNRLDTKLSDVPEIVLNTNRQYWLEQATKGNLKLQKQRLLVSAAEYNVKEKSRVNGAVVTGVASVGVQDGGGYDSRYRDGAGGYIGINVKIPLTGRSKNVQTTQARYEQLAAQDDVQAQHLQVTQTVNKMMQAISLDKKIISTKKLTINSASEALKLSQLAYKSGQAGASDVLLAQRNLTMAQKELITAKYAAANHVLELLQVSGMLTLDNIKRAQLMLE